MNKRKRIYLARHGQVAGYERTPVYGHTDVEMTDVGRLQMEHLAERLRLADLSAIYCSDLERTRLGARIIGRYHDVPHHVSPDLREMYFGDWEGLTLEGIRERFPEDLERRKSDIVDFAPPGGGESIGQLSGRVLACVRKILKRHEEEDILIVAHGGVNRVILSYALELDLSHLFNLHQAYGCLNIIDYFPDATLVRLING